MLGGKGVEKDAERKAVAEDVRTENVGRQCQYSHRKWTCVVQTIGSRRVREVVAASSLLIRQSRRLLQACTSLHHKYSSRARPSNILGQPDKSTMALKPSMTVALIHEKVLLSIGSFIRTMSGR